MAARSVATAAARRDPPVLCVDLDGTLVRTDLLWESLLLVLKREPWVLLLLPLWLLRGGRAHVKERIARRVAVDAAVLPYHEELLAFLQAEHAAGRRLVLATATHRRLAEPVADHLGLFDEVIATAGVANLAGAAKGRALAARFGAGGFDYVGNSHADVAVWRAARQALVVAPSRGLLTRARAAAPVGRIFPGRPGRVRALVAALRLHQWVKNILIFVPLATSHTFTDPARVGAALWAFLAFGVCASGVYVLNDLLDLAMDRRHPRKRRRPFAAGMLPIPVGVALVPTLFAVAFTLSLLTLPLGFTGILAAYLAVTTAYTFWLKRLEVLDVIVLALLYTARVVGGAVAIGVVLSPWLSALSVFVFLSLAVLKRYAELGVVGETLGRGYVAGDRAWLGQVGVTSGYLAVLVFALYIYGDGVRALYGRPEILWLACPALLYWITRLWFLAQRGRVDDDPVVFAGRDRVSWVVAALVGLVMLAAR
jgi:4-hydroxybenzoate polyprenyltransferase